jgi:ABC-type antimicrobial peptide transport system permease subunit
MDPDAIEAMGYELLTGSYDIGGTLGKDKYPVLIGSQLPFAFADTKRADSDPNRYKSAEYDEDYTEIVNSPRYDASGRLENPEDFFFDIMSGKLKYRIEIGWDEETGASRYKDIELVPVGMLANIKGDYTISGSFVMSIENAKRLEQSVQKLRREKTGGLTGMIISGESDGNSKNAGGYPTVLVKCNDIANMPDIEKEIKSIGYEINSLSDIRGEMQGQVAQAQLMLGSLAAISLFVAAIGIMNTMNMAITERTKEIGVMKVVGCRLRDIRRSLLIESGAIGLLGGIIGCAVSILISLALNDLPRILSALKINSSFDLAGMFGMSGLTQSNPDAQLSIIPIWLLAAGLFFAMAVGLISGILPANKAVKISSLEALRHE